MIVIGAGGIDASVGEDSGAAAVALDIDGDFLPCAAGS